MSLAAANTLRERKNEKNKGEGEDVPVNRTGRRGVEANSSSGQISEQQTWTKQDKTTYTLL